jgi:hypothetical protein
MGCVGKWLGAHWAGVVLAAVPAAAQDAPGTTGPAAAVSEALPDAGAGASAIVVTGRADPPTRDDVYDQARALTRVGRFQLHDEPLPRFQLPLCPGVFGLQADAAQTVAARIRANADQLSIRLAKSGCSPNLIVDFVDDGRTVMSDIAQKHHKAFCIITTEEQTELLDQEAPVRVWLHTRTIDTRRTGAPVRIVRCHEDIPSRSGGPGARLGVPMRKDIFFALVLFDRSAALQLTLEQVADYATMRGLSGTRPATGDEHLSTILGLFGEGGEHITELTSFDRGYLRSLYESPGSDSAANRLLAVRRHAMRQQRDEEASGQ